MRIYGDYFTPNVLTGYARTALLNLPINATSLARWLPWVPVDDLVYRFVRGGDSLIEAAPYRSYDAESSITGRPGLTRVSGELPPISRKIVLTEYDRLRQRANPDDAIRAAILGDVERLVRQITMRLEVARADALVNGQVTINENGVQASVSFGRSGGASVTAGTLWSTVATADPITNLTDWQQAYVDLNGVPPGVILTSTRVRGLLMKNAAIRAEAATLNGSPAMVSAETLQAVLTNYDLPRLETYDVRYSVNGTPTRVIADNIALLLPAPGNPNEPGSTDLGGTFVGTTAESLDPTYSLAGEEAGIVAGNYRSEDPISIWTKAAAISLPVLATPDMAFKATVAT
jgi:hypothetical protein